MSNPIAKQKYLVYADGSSKLLLDPALYASEILSDYAKMDSLGVLEKFDLDNDLSSTIVNHLEALAARGYMETIGECDRYILCLFKDIPYVNGTRTFIRACLKKNTNQEIYDRWSGEITESTLRPNGSNWVHIFAKASDGASLHDNAALYDSAEVSGNVVMKDRSCVGRNARVSGNVLLFDRACVYGRANLYGNVVVRDVALVSGVVELSSNIKISGRCTLFYNDDRTDQKEGELLDYVQKNTAAIKPPSEKTKISARDIMELNIPVGSLIDQVAYLGGTDQLEGLD